MQKKSALPVPEAGGKLSSIAQDEAIHVVHFPNSGEPCRTTMVQLSATNWHHTNLGEQ